MSNDCFTITTQEAFCNGYKHENTEDNNTCRIEFYHPFLAAQCSECLSVTLLNHAYMVQDIETSFAPQDKDTFQLSGDQIF